MRKPPQLLNKYAITLNKRITWVTDRIQSLHSVQVVVATLEIETHFKRLSTNDKVNVIWLGDRLICDPCFSRSSSSDRRRGSKQISWTLESLESISSFKPWKDKVSSSTMATGLPLSHQRACLGDDLLYLGCIVTDRCVGSSARSHCETHNLPFNENEQQHKHLKAKTFLKKRCRLVTSWPHHYETRSKGCWHYKSLTRLP